MPICFVAMGFGIKTAYYGGKKKPRALDLDKTYQHIIEPAVIAAGLNCVRADEIQHSTVIDKPMYENLLAADVVVADTSTSNANAIYELGVRHALRPFTTLVMAEQDFAFPFDIARLNILRYKHLGEDIGAGEAARVAKELTHRLQAVLENREIDSPVFWFLPNLKHSHAAASLFETNVGLTPNPAADVAGKMMRLAQPFADRATANHSDGNAFENLKAAQQSPSLAGLRTAFGRAKAKASKPEDWLEVIEALQALQLLERGDPFIVQQLALATYKSQHPDKISALKQARHILLELQPQMSGEAETIGLWGAIHKRLWEAQHSTKDLDEAITSYGRGFALKRDHYNGVNYAFLLDERAGDRAGDEAIADRVLARRARAEVLTCCGAQLLSAQQRHAETQSSELYWLLASRAEALFGLGRRDEAALALQAAKELKPTPEAWMTASTEEQLAKLAKMLGPRA